LNEYNKDGKGGFIMKVNFFFAWTKNKDKSNEYMKSIGGGIKLPSFLRWLNVFRKNPER